jgi:hypothetical protein
MFGGEGKERVECGQVNNVDRFSRNYYLPIKVVIYSLPMPFVNGRAPHSSETMVAIDLGTMVEEIGKEATTWAAGRGDLRLRGANVDGSTAGRSALGSEKLHTGFRTALGILTGAVL